MSLRAGDGPPLVAHERLDVAAPDEQATVAVEIRRSRNGGRCPPYEFDTQAGIARLNGEVVALTPKEFELAVMLFRNVDRLMSRGHLQESVWGRSGELATRTVDTHVSQVRKKLDRPDLIRTVRGAGYKAIT